MKTVLFIDFDGTLAPLADAPHKAFMPARVRDLLRKLSRDRNFKIVIISGRDIKDLREKVGLKNIIYAGSHGLEIKGPGINLNIAKSSASTRVLRGILAGLRKALFGIKGVLIENKGLSVAFHYRLVSGADKKRAVSVFKNLVEPFRRASKIKILPGKKVFEVCLPVNWDKGRAALYIILKLFHGETILPIYVGDDVTDEKAFKALRGAALTIHVGEKHDTAAEFGVKDTRGVYRLIANLAAQRGG